MKADVIGGEEWRDPGASRRVRSFVRSSPFASSSSALTKSASASRRLPQNHQGTVATAREQIAAAVSDAGGWGEKAVLDLRFLLVAVVSEPLAEFQRLSAQPVAAPF